MQRIQASKAYIGDADLLKRAYQAAAVSGVKGSETMSEEFVPSTLEAAMGDDTPAEPVAQAEPETPEPEKVVEAAEPEKEDVVEEVVKDEPPAVEAQPDKQDNVVAMRKVIAEQSVKLKEFEKAPPVPDVLDDPDGFRAHMTGEFDVKFANMSEAMAKSQFPDYEEVATRFYEEAAKNPAVIQAVKNSAHPALEVYNQGKRLNALDDIGDPAAYEAKIEARVRAKIEAALKGEATKTEADKAKLKNSLPDDLTSEANVGSRAAAMAGPTPLDKLFPD